MGSTWREGGEVFGWRGDCPVKVGLFLFFVFRFFSSFFPLFLACLWVWVGQTVGQTDRISEGRLHEQIPKRVYDALDGRGGLFLPEAGPRGALGGRKTAEHKPPSK